MWTEEELKLFKEFRDFKLSEIKLEHIEAKENFANTFEGRLCSDDTMKLLELTKYLLSKRT